MIGHDRCASPDTFNTFTAQVSVSYTPDVFGANFRAVESLEAQAENQRFQLEATYLTLTTNIVVAAVQEASLRGQIAATQKIIRIASDLLELLRRQNKLGQIAEADVVAQEAALAQIQQTLPPLQRQLEQQRHLLASSIGRFPSQGPTRSFDLAIAATAARSAGHACPRNSSSSARTSGPPRRICIPPAPASALRSPTGCPTSRLRPTPAARRSTLSQAALASHQFWTLDRRRPAADLPWRRAECSAEVAARAAYDQAAAQYRSTVRSAFQNVADALTAMKTDADALQKAVAAERAAYRSLEITRQPPAAWRHQLSRAAQRAADLSAGADQSACRRRPPATPIRPRCFRRSAAAGGTAMTSRPRRTRPGWSSSEPGGTASTRLGCRRRSAKTPFLKKTR